MTSKHYLVTGAAGFIASQVCEQLLGAGHTVDGIDNLNDAYDTRLKDWRLERLQKVPGFTFHELDISNRDSLRRVLDALPIKPVAVVNLAARAGVRQSVETPQIYIDTNVTGTLNMLDYCRDAGVSKFLLASTSSLYGAHNDVPFSEDADTTRPLSPYAASKMGAESLCHSYHHLHGLDITVVRYFTVFGPAGRPDMSIFRFVQWIAEGREVIVYGDGSQSRDFTFVEDIARGTILALKPLGYEVINLGSDSPHKLMQTIRWVEKGLGKSANIVYRPFPKADVTRTWANVSKAKKLLGWQAQVSAEEGVQRCVEWYQQERAWAADVTTISPGE